MSIPIICQPCTYVCNSNETCDVKCEPGPQGDTGPSGDKGPSGNKGLLGDQGPPGQQGTTGAKGSPGTNGADGVDGSPNIYYIQTDIVQFTDPSSNDNYISSSVIAANTLKKGSMISIFAAGKITATIGSVIQINKHVVIGGHNNNGGYGMQTPFIPPTSGNFFNITIDSTNVDALNWSAHCIITVRDTVAYIADARIYGELNIEENSPGTMHRTSTTIPDPGYITQIDTSANFYPTLSVSMAKVGGILPDGAFVTCDQAIIMLKK